MDEIGTVDQSVAQHKADNPKRIATGRGRPRLATTMTEMLATTPGGDDRRRRSARRAPTTTTRHRSVLTTNGRHWGGPIVTVTSTSNIGGAAELELRHGRGRRREPQERSAREADGVGQYSRSGRTTDSDSDV
jgi:hypothetical protein